MKVKMELVSNVKHPIIGIIYRKNVGVVHKGLYLMWKQRYAAVQKKNPI